MRLIANRIQTQGVIYAEFRFAPQLHTQRGMTQEDVILAAIEGTKKTKLRVNLILCLYRGNEEKKIEDNKETLELAKKYLNQGIVAIDLVGSESEYKTEDYKDYFLKAREYGIPFTIHAGEADGPESIRHAIEFGAKRIGHGTKAFESESVLKLIKEKGIFLEMCPTSNLMTHTINKIEEFPFMDYLKQGIKVTLNTDDMAIAKTTLAKEFLLMEENFNLTYDQEKIILLNSIEASFATDEVKKELKKELGL